MSAAQKRGAPAGGGGGKGKKKKPDTPTKDPDITAQIIRRCTIAGCNKVLHQHDNHKICLSCRFKTAPCSPRNTCNFCARWGRPSWSKEQTELRGEVQRSAIVRTAGQMALLEKKVVVMLEICSVYSIPIGYTTKEEWMASIRARSERRGRALAQSLVPQAAPPPQAALPAAQGAQQVSNNQLNHKMTILSQQQVKLQTNLEYLKVSTQYTQDCIAKLMEHHGVALPPRQEQLPAWDGSVVDLTQD